MHLTKQCHFQSVTWESRRLPCTPGLQEAPSFFFFSSSRCFGTPVALTFEKVGTGGPGWFACRMKVPDGQAGVPADITTLSDAMRDPAPQTILVSEGGRRPPLPPSPLLCSSSSPVSRRPSGWLSTVHCRSFPTPPPLQLVSRRTLVV